MLIPMICRICLVLSVLLVMGPEQPAAGESLLPFGPGEKLIFDLKWGHIGAGKAVLKVMNATNAPGVEALHFVLTVKSGPTLDMIFKIRDTLEAHAHPAMTHSLMYRQKIREGGYRKRNQVAFDWGKQQAIYSKNGKIRKVIPLQPGTFDPLSAFYYLRLQDIAVGKTFERPITDGKKTIVGRARIIKKETILVANRQYETYMIEPELQAVGGAFQDESQGTVHIWITADEKKIPVLIKSKTAFGTLTAQLAAIRDPKSAPQ